jgi:hypothetical protein
MISIAASASKRATKSLLKRCSRKVLSRKTNEVSLRTQTPRRVFSTKCGEMMASQRVDCKVIGDVFGMLISSL